MIGCYDPPILSPPGAPELGATPYDSQGDAMHARNISRNISARESSTTSMNYEFKIIEYDKFMCDT